MVSNRLPVILIALAILLAILYSSIFVVNAREQAIVVRFGQIQSVKSEPGLYFKLPFGFMDADRVQFVEKRALRLDLDNIRVQVQDGQTFDVDAFVIYNISDVRRFRETVSATATLPRHGCVRSSIPRFAASTVCVTTMPRFRKSAWR